MTNEAYWDATLPVEERVRDLLGRMTLREKIGQMLQLDARTNLDDTVLNKTAGSILHTSPDDLPRANELVQATRLRIPLLVGDDLIHGYSFYPGATIFPEQLGMAVSWDAAKIERAAKITAREAVTTGVQWTFSPVLDAARDTRWGRVGETFGEDPYLIGELASAMVRGYQGGSLTGEATLGKKNILATAKHFAGYSETQGGRDASEADLSRRKLTSWLLPPFERVAKEGIGTFMLGYESIEGVPITLNKWLLNDVLRDKWGYTGTLITDWANVSRLVWEQRVLPNPVLAAVAAVRAGNDLIMTSPEFYDAAYEAVERGLLTEDELDAPVSRILALKFRLGLFEDPRLPDAAAAKKVIGNAAHSAANLDLTRESVALLRNDGTLPLPHKAHKVALIGPLIDDAQTQLGDWAGNSGQVSWMPDGHPRSTITTVQDGFERLMPHDWTLTTAEGARIVDLVPDPAGEFYPDGQPRPYVGQSAPVDDALIREAVAKAQAADVAVVVVGDVIQLIGEGCSTATLELLGGQNALLDAVIATDTPTVVVLMSSKPQILPDSVLHDAAALLWAPSPGMKGGQAIAEIIMGMVSPSGRLPISFPRHAGQLPVYYNQIRGQHGDRYADLTQDPAFAFGEGLSYTTFSYGDVRFENVTREVESVEDVDTSVWTMGSADAQDESDAPAVMIPAYGHDDTVRVSIDVTNTGSLKGVEVVQAYIGDLVTSVSWTNRELKAFQRVELAAGETRTVTFEIPVSACSIVDAEANRVVENGEFEVLLGHSSRRRDLKRAVFAVTD
ncbi:glycoside hydrolase family 3 N-terminal domain-containing protein [Alloscardovia macacae]|uniref:Exo-alpha-(1->6)-L-arabinopyranosidase n=1 Tax=Alloscardovia macacae TaxID=1160091 RepID=A0A261F5J5_9BIFI|nr:glycoside hydrolase family 3 N-terminal domain-containing protein [Alloscardovia macacae]OZG54402.1 beta-glucosidase [Alloscardovia macacae]